VLLSIVLCGVFLPVRTSGAQSPAEYRGFWVDTFNTRLNTPDDVAAVVARGVGAHANVLLVQVRRRGDAWYLRSLEPLPDGVPIARDFDPLQEVIAQAHGAGLQVHAHVVVADIWNQASLPANPAHVFNLHGLTPAGTPAEGRANWLTRTLLPDGTSTSYSGYRFGTDFWIDLGHPDAAAYTVAVIMRLVASYDLDGVHLDRLQYPDPAAAAPPGTAAVEAGSSTGYNATSLERYRRRFDLAADTVPPATDPSWSEWRREQTWALMRRLYLEITAVKPSLVVSVAAVTGGDPPADEAAWFDGEAAGRAFQDWRAWLRDGIVDLAIPMVYQPEHTQAGAMLFARWTAWTYAQAGVRHAAMGLGAYLNSIEGTLRQVRVAVGQPARDPASLTLAPVRGALLFAMGAHNAPVSSNPLVQRDTPYRSFEDLAAGLTTGHTSLGQSLEPAARPVFAQRVPVPVMPWKVAPAVGHVKGTVTTIDGAAVDGAAVLIESEDGSLTIDARHTDGNGFFGALGLAPADYRVSIVAADGGRRRSACTVTVTAGVVATIDLRIALGSPAPASCAPRD
jgi:uncharacterized lipoprotein YddW (UPF0748 family)